MWAGDPGKIRAILKINKIGFSRSMVVLLKPLCSPWATLRASCQHRNYFGNVKGKEEESAGVLKFWGSGGGKGVLKL
jgi:hypothetical protein